MNREIESLEKHGVWETSPIEPTPEMSIVKCKFIFRKKEGSSEGEIFKARLVAQGFSQVEGVDFSETFSGVVDKVGVRVCFHVIASRNFTCAKFDVSTAFLNTTLSEDIYVALPNECSPRHRDLSTN